MRSFTDATARTSPCATPAISSAPSIITISGGGSSLSPREATPRIPAPFPGPSRGGLGAGGDRHRLAPPRLREASRGILAPPARMVPGARRHTAGRTTCSILSSRLEAPSWATPSPSAASFAPVQSPSGLSVFIRDADATKAVWSDTEGYPSDPVLSRFLPRRRLRPRPRLPCSLPRGRRGEDVHGLQVLGGHRPHGREAPLRPSRSFRPRGRARRAVSGGTPGRGGEGGGPHG